ncbi:unnamed protein product [Ceratitis capitata]|uniref:(Mediterranean fruit fly) hypothetical protein n=1 Tax=Ceratitis capitata TaxID=7213 RepID=A0A811U9P8_CERCA|nr:unnamed protein product [Ceratitis capitata]
MIFEIKRMKRDPQQKHPTKYMKIIYLPTGNAEKISIKHFVIFFCILPRGHEQVRTVNPP